MREICKNCVHYGALQDKACSNAFSQKNYPEPNDSCSGFMSKAEAAEFMYEKYELDPEW